MLVLDPLASRHGVAIETQWSARRPNTSLERTPERRLAPTFEWRYGLESGISRVVLPGRLNEANLGLWHLKARG